VFCSPTYTLTQHFPLLSACFLTPTKCLCPIYISYAALCIFLCVPYYSPSVTVCVSPPVWTWAGPAPTPPTQAFFNSCVCNALGIPLLPACVVGRRRFDSCPPNALFFPMCISTTPWEVRTHSPFSVGQAGRRQGSPGQHVGVGDTIPAWKVCHTHPSPLSPT